VGRVRLYSMNELPWNNLGARAAKCSGCDDGGFIGWQLHGGYWQVCCAHVVVQVAE